LQEYSELFLKIPNCAELHLMSELWDVKAALSVKNITLLPMLKKLELSDGDSCEKVELSIETGGPSIHRIGYIPESSAHDTFKQTAPAQLIEVLVMTNCTGDALADSSSSPADVPLESRPPIPSKEHPTKEANFERTALKPAPPEITSTLEALKTLQALKFDPTTLT